MNILQAINKPSDIKALTIEQLRELARDIRQLILDTVIKNGGHLASSLGAVEIIIAMHYVFDAPQDKFLFDVGHQSYAHKILTGRKDNFGTLRQFGGISGFPKREESEYDVANTGHSSTSISIGTGLAKAEELSGTSNRIVSLIGDGAMTGGLAYEALNYSSNNKVKQIVILNDNSMSIGKNVGHVAKYLVRLHGSNAYRRIKKNAKAILRELHVTDTTKSERFLSDFKNAIKYFVQSGMPFDQYGYDYFGPIDGHDLEELINVFNAVKDQNENVLIHVVTKKGKGYLEAEESPGKFHGYSPCGVKDPDTFNFSDTFGNTLLRLAEEDKRIVAVTAAMADGTGLTEFQKNLPERLVDVAIAEGQGAAMSAGLAIAGYKPYFAVYSSFLQRACDQVIHDVALQKLPVTFCIDRAGIVPNDGETHQGIYDVAMLRAIPDMAIASPKDPEELKRMLEFSLDYDKPLAIRYPKGCFKNIASKDTDITKYEYLRRGSYPVTVLACGALMVREALKAAELTEKDISIVNARFVKPLDAEFLDSLKGKVITLEDSLICGGFGGAVAEYCTINKNKDVDLSIFAIEDEVLTHGTVEELLRLSRLDAESIAQRIEDEA